jgi:hemerythrin
MTHFYWDPTLETGVARIDEQHRGLFALANQLQSAIEQCDLEQSERCEPEIDALANAIYGLTDYCVEHFADEEDLMLAAGYPQLPTHRSLHEQLAGGTLKYAAQYFNDDDVIPETLAAFFTQWLTDHIRTEDMRFVAYLRERKSAD